MSDIPTGHLSDTGKVRELNEDCLLVQPGAGLWLIADGMGGYAAGEIASKIVAEKVAWAVANGYNLTDSLESANKAILDALTNGEGGQGMGSTAVALQLDHGKYQVAWVGDSRAYKWDGTALQQLTRDHSYVQQLIDRGALSHEEARNHPQRNVITQALGGTVAGVKIDTAEGMLYRGERIMLCSDGLTSELDDADIAEIFAREGGCQETVNTLVEMANLRGGHDNISVIIVEAPGNFPGRNLSSETQPMVALQLQKIDVGGKRRFLFSLFIAAGVLVAGLLLMKSCNTREQQQQHASGGGVKMGAVGPLRSLPTTETTSVSAASVGSVDGGGTGEATTLDNTKSAISQSLSGVKETAEDNLQPIMEANQLSREHNQPVVQPENLPSNQRTATYPQGFE